MSPPETVDLLIVGAGPAGLAAATAAARTGATVLLLDSQPSPGGQIWRAADRAGSDARRVAAFGKGAARAVRALSAAQAAGVQRIQDAEIIDLSTDRTAVWLHRGPPVRMRQSQARAVILATGAMERPVVFPGVGLPGVMGVGALQIAMKQGGMVPEGRIVLAGQGPLMLLTLSQLRSFAANVVTVASPGGRWAPGSLAGAGLAAAAAKPALITEGLLLALRRGLSGVPSLYGLTGLEAIGTNRLEAVRLKTRSGTHEISCSVLGVHDGVVPETQLPRLVGLQHRWDPTTACFVPEADDFCQSSIEGFWVAGDGAGIAGWQAAEVSGQIAGMAASHALGLGPAPPKALRREIARIRVARRFIEAVYPPLAVDALASDDAILCHCEGVTVGTVRSVIREGATGPNRVKTATRCGMGPCQGRQCGQALTRLIAHETGRSAGEVGALRIRPPLKPVLAVDYATLASGA